MPLPWSLLGVAALTGAAAGADPQVCGCTWRRDGCGISGEQFIASVEALPYAVAGCADGLGVQTEECQLRRRLAMDVGPLTECAALDFFACNASEACSWGAQQIGVCGFDEDRILRQLASSRPFVRYLNRHFACSPHGASTCEQAGCRWSVNRTHPECDAEATPATDFDPVEWWLVYAEGTCRARSEARRSDGFSSRCSAPCRMQNGVCSFDRAGGGHDWVDVVKDRYCALRWAETRRERRHAMASWGVTGKDVSLKDALKKARTSEAAPVMASVYDWCPKTWCRVSDGLCRGAPGSPGPEGADGDTRRLRRLALLWSATALYERRCRAPDMSLRAACEASAPVCGRSASSRHRATAPMALVAAEPQWTLAAASAMAGGAVVMGVLGLVRRCRRCMGAARDAARDAPFPGATRSPPAPLMHGGGGSGALREAELRRLQSDAWA